MKSRFKEENPSSHLRAGVLDKVLWVVAIVAVGMVGWYFVELFLLD